MRIFRKKREIVLTIHDGDQGSSASSGSPGVLLSGVISPTREIEYLPRRAQKVKGNLNFYDLGEYLQNEAWFDDQKSIVPTSGQMTDILVNGNPATRFQDFLNLFLNDILARYNDKPLSTSLSDWKATFRRLSRSDGAKLGLYCGDFQTGADSLLNQQNPNWTDSGLKINESQNFNDLFFAEGYFELGDNPKYNFLVASAMHIFPRFFDPSVKITSLLDFSATAINPSEITIDSQKEINYFLSRQLTFPVFYFLATNPSLRIESFLNYSFFAITRRNSIDSLLNVKRDGIAGAIWDAVKHFARIDNAREIHAVFNSDGSTDSFASPIPATATYTDFPQDASGIRLPTANGYLDYGSLTLPFESAISGCLLGAINQGDDWFFIWRA